VSSVKCCSSFLSAKSGAGIHCWWQRPWPEKDGLGIARRKRMQIREQGGCGVRFSIHVAYLVLVADLLCCRAELMIATCVTTFVWVWGLWAPRNRIWQMCRRIHCDSLTDCLRLLSARNHGLHASRSCWGATAMVVSALVVPQWRGTAPRCCVAEHHRGVRSKIDSATSRRRLVENRFNDITS
jgi:hypothetical protein